MQNASHAVAGELTAHKPHTHTAFPCPALLYPLLILHSHILHTFASLKSSPPPSPQPLLCLYLRNIFLIITNSRICLSAFSLPSFAVCFTSRHLPTVLPSFYLVLVLVLFFGKLLVVVLLLLLLIWSFWSMVAGFVWICRRRAFFAICPRARH